MNLIRGIDILLVSVSLVCVHVYGDIYSDADCVGTIVLVPLVCMHFGCCVLASATTLYLDNEIV